MPKWFRFIVAPIAIAMSLAGAAQALVDVVYTYDSLGRLKTAYFSATNITVTYTYDRAGNRTQVIASGP